MQLVRTKLSRASHLLFKIRKYVPIAVLKMLYYSFVYCHLQYCIMSKGTANNSVLQPLNVLHNIILRIMTCGNYRCHVTPSYKNLNALKLNDIYRLELAKFMHKLHHGALPKIFENFFKNLSYIHSYRTRFADNQNFLLQRVCRNSGKKCISYGGAALWKEIEQSENPVLCHFLQTLWGSPVKLWIDFSPNIYGYIRFNGKIWLLHEYDEKEICLVVFFFMWIMYFAEVLLLLRLRCLKCVCALWHCLCSMVMVMVYCFIWLSQ